MRRQQYKQVILLCRWKGTVLLISKLVTLWSRNSAYRSQKVLHNTVTQTQSFLFIWCFQLIDMQKVSNEYK